MVEIILLSGQIFEIEILISLHVMRSTKTENQIFSLWSVCMRACVSVISITQKQIIEENPNFVL